MDWTALLIGLSLLFIVITWFLIRLSRRHGVRREKTAARQGQKVYRRHGVTSAWQDDNLESSLHGE